MNRNLQDGDLQSGTQEAMARAVTITALPLHRGNEMPTAVLRSSRHHRTVFRGTRPDFLQRGNKTRQRSVTLV